MSPRIVPFAHASLLALTLLSGCARAISNQSASLVSSSSIWLRNTYDTDPSIYVGRFVPPGVTELDESNTMVLACSKHITTRFIEGGNVDYTEEMQVNNQAALRLGMPVIASGSAGYQHSRTAQARYKLTGKLVAEITDPEAFAACCKEQPDQCTDRYIGEFIQGTGALYHAASRSVDLEGEGTNPNTGISGEGGFGRSAEWQRAAEFPEPVYFAFKVNPTPYTQATVDSCPGWVERPPSADDGFYVVGSADEHRNESSARNSAIQHATGMAYQTAGVSVPVRADSWCVTTTQKRRKVLYSARVLGFVSNAAVDHAREQAREQARLEAEREQARLEAEREQARLKAEARQARLDAWTEAARLEAEREAARREAEQREPVDNPNDHEPVDNPDDHEPADNPDDHEPVDNPDDSEPRPDPGTGERDIDRILAAVEAEAWSTDKLSALAFASKGASLTAAEARLVLDAIAMSSDKLEALKILRGTITDVENWQVLVDAFTFSEDREAARALAL